MNTLSFTIEEKDETFTVHLYGAINEFCSEPLNKLEEVTGSKVILNFKNIEYINSRGTKNFAKFVDSYQKNRQVQLTECTSAIMVQVSCYPKFIGNCEILSFYGNFYCENCGEEANKLFQSKDGYNAILNASQNFPCPNCSDKMELEEYEETFLQFLNTNKSSTAS